MISTCVPGIFVSSQLSRMPGEERKFRRRRRVAFDPTCKRERESAASQAEVNGISAAGVTVDSTTEVAVGEGRRLGMDVAGFVSVGAGIGDGVRVNPGDAGTVVGFAVSGCSVAAGGMEGVAKALVGKRVAAGSTD